MSKHFIISATQVQGFNRCGTFFPFEGKKVARDDFDETQWARLQAEPRLRIAAAIKEVEAELDARPELIRNAIRELAPADFAGDGKPKVDALSEALKQNIKGKVRAAERDEAWDALIAEGFEAPKAE